jgi:DNA-dependent RNA polymerase
MVVISEEIVSKTEQKRREKALKQAAVDKKMAALQLSLAAGLASDTEVSKFIKSEWIGAAGKLANRIAPLTFLSNRDRKEVSHAIEFEFMPLLGKYGAERQVELAMANRLVSIAFDELLNIAFRSDGEYLSWAGAYREQQLQELYHAVARRVDIELRLMSIAEEAPHVHASLITVQNNPAYSAAAKAVALQAVLRGHSAFEQVSLFMQLGNAYQLPENVAPPCVEFSQDDLNSIAAFLIKCATEAVPEEGIFWKHKTVVDAENDGKAACFVVLADHLNADEVIEEAAKRAHRYEPCDQVEPWIDESGKAQSGGYALNAVTKEQPFIRGRQHDSQASALVRKCVSNVQSVRYIVNDFILGIVNELSNEKISFGKFVSPKGVHYTKSMRSRTAVAAANQWQGRSFVSPWSIDWRGRMYPISSVLTIQTTDFEKSLLKFAIDRPVNSNTAYWLGVHLANTYAVGGVDKLPLDARVEWANSDEAQQLIIDVATKPIDMIHAWVADDSSAPGEPWEFIAACEEFYALYLAPVAQRRHATNLPVAVDASCSGIQILSGLIKDAAAGKLVNITPSEEKQDAYEAVASAIREVMQQPVKVERQEVVLDDNGDPEIVKKSGNVRVKKVERVVDMTAYAHLVSRSVVKKLVMTLPYNASAQAQGEYVREALKPVRNQIDDSILSDFYWAIGHYGRKALATILPQVIAVKDWIAEAAGDAAERAEDARKKGVEMSWSLHYETPSGMVIGQSKRQWEVVLVDSVFAGKRKRIVLAIEPADKSIERPIDVAKYVSGTMPNIVHALDASVLHVAFAEFDKPFALIHDSVLATASDIADAIAAYKASYIKHFSDDALYEQLIEVLGAADAAPQQGTLNVSEVEHSQFFLA